MVDLGETPCIARHPAIADPTTPEPWGEDEFDALVRAHQAGLWRYLRFLGCEDVQADDLVQETFVAVWRRPFERRSAVATAAYLRTVSRNLFLMEIRRRRVRPLVEGLEAAEGAWARHVGSDEGDGYREALRVCLGRLPEKPGRALSLQYRDGASRDTIAAALGMRPDGVKTLVRRARDMLRKCITERLGR